MINLDVGCGIQQKGDLNLDIIRENKDHSKFIQADLNHGLPFKDNAIENILCHHVIEHIDNPEYLLKELIRVSKNVVEIRTPHRLSYTAKSDHSHKNFFNLAWFKKIAYDQGFMCHGFVRIDNDRPLIHRVKGWVPRILPLELFVMILKKNKPKRFALKCSVW